MVTGQTTSLRERAQADIFIPFVVTRVAMMVVALAAMAWLPSIQGTQFTHISPSPLIDLWHRWDAGFYTKIALYGYGWQAGLRDGDATFMPLYPLLIGLPLKLLSNPTRVEAAVIGVLLSNACLLGSLFYFDALLTLDGASSRRRRLARWLLLVAPTTIYFSGVYTESLFFLLSLMSIYYARQSRWLIAGLAAFLAAATRVVGWTLIFLLAWEVWQQRKRFSLRSLARGAAVLTPLAPLPMYAGLVGLMLGAPKALFEITRAVWAQGVGVPWRAFTEFFNGPIDFFGWDRSLVDLLFLLVFVLLAIAAFRSRINYGLYGLAILVFPIWSGTLMSIPRYGAVGFPYYDVLAKWVEGHRWRTRALLVSSALIAAYFTARFVTWHWVA